MTGNWYATPYDVTIQAAHAPNANVQKVMANFLERVSRRIDTYCRRHFYSQVSTYYNDGTMGNRLIVPDLLSITSLTADTDNDGVYDDETWVDGTDYFLENLGLYARYPKNCIRITERGSYCFSVGPRRYKIAGNWGYGDGLRADPWDLLTSTGTIADTTGTTLTLSAALTDYSLYTGHTILIESEQMFVSSYSASGTSATVVRGVNGTTAAAHSAKPIYKAVYPSDIVQTCKDITVECMVNRDDFASQAEIAKGDFRTANEDIFWRNLRNIAGYRRVVVA